MVLKVAGLELPLIDSPFGPALANLHGDLRALELVVNEVLSGAFPELETALERGEDARTAYYSVAHPLPGEPFEQERTCWRELTGEDAGDDVYVIGVEFYD